MKLTQFLSFRIKSIKKLSDGNKKSICDTMRSFGQDCVKFKKNGALQDEISDFSYDKFCVQVDKIRSIFKFFFGEQIFEKYRTIAESLYVIPSNLLGKSAPKSSNSELHTLKQTTSDNKCL